MSEKTEETPKDEPPKKGDIITEKDGSEWWVHFVSTINGKPNYSKIRVGSLAAKMLGYET